MLSINLDVSKTKKNACGQVYMYNNDFQQVLREETCLLLSCWSCFLIYHYACMYILHVCVFPHKLFSTMHNVDDAICTINWSDYTNYRQLN